MSLSRIQSLRLAAVVEDCADQLEILGHTLTVQIRKERGDSADQEIARLTKLRRDCQSITQQVSLLHVDLEEKQCITSLVQLGEEEEQKKRDDQMRREAKKELEQRNQALRIQHEETQEKNEKLKDLSKQARDLQHKMEDLSGKMAHRKKLEEKNLELQLQQTQREGSQTGKLLEHEQELLQRQIKEETRVHEESETFLQRRNEEVQQQQEQWQQSTKQRLQEKEQRLNTESCKRTVNLDRLMEMKRMYRGMEQVVMEDRDEQEKLRQEQAKARAVTKVQAWWRGCMVRRCLGSFKKEEDKKAEGSACM
ncbi:dynein regulatory complex protein 9 isoform X2 [Pseudochaenichthys georgianus]|uniref:dynein regulatory complex protein 9 isoform X2 n=1 Tax=Pseudochaenichthys georgianus TaxID=52239 RepID=UPI00146B49A4|nr:dynein regulatory complex protein 9 isoform X2 [Pseudochaenichthys georgianus]